MIGAIGVASLAPSALTNATAVPVSAHPVADAVAALDRQQTAEAQARPAALPVTAPRPKPTLNHLQLPTIDVQAASQGYADRDVRIDASPDLDDRELSFELQRAEGDTWVAAHSGTTTGAAETAVIENLPAGTYRVAFPAQHGLQPHIGEPFTHSPRVLAATLSHDSATGRTTIDVNPDSVFTVTLQRNSGDWQPVRDYTTDAAGQIVISDLPSGTYRVVVPDQADSIGTTTNEVAFKSLADQRAEAERAARAAAEAAARAQARAQARQQAQQARPQAQAVQQAGRPSSAPAAPAPAPAPQVHGGGIVGTAMSKVGSAYRLGGNGPSVFDCSGLTSYAYRAAGISIPRTASAQYAAARKVAEPQPGDLVFFLNGAQHVGIYIGGGRMVHAANPSRGVEVTSIHSGWYGRTFTGYGRF